MTSRFDALDPSKLKEFGVSSATVAEIFARVVMAAPLHVPQADIAEGIITQRDTRGGGGGVAQGDVSPGLAKLPQGSVSRAAGLLVELGLLAREEPQAIRPGRPIVPLTLGPDWALIGVRIDSRGGRPVEVSAVLASLDGTRIEKGPLTADLSETAGSEALVKTIADLLHQLTRGQRHKILGIGVEMGGHVHEGRVIPVTSSESGGFPLSDRLAKALRGKLAGKPVVIENEVHARAAWQIWAKDRESEKLSIPTPHFAVVAVFEDDIGGALVIDRKVYRGSSGMAGAIGHLTVDRSRPHQPASPRPEGAVSWPKGFDDPCHCAGTRGGTGYGHVAALATPSRIAGELAIEDSRFPEIAKEPATDADGDPTRASEVFRTAGEALGRGIAALLNIANPGDLMLMLPEALAEPADGTAAAAYRSAIETTLDAEGFSTAAADARAGRSTLRIKSVEAGDLRAARPARVSVVDSFIAQARAGADPDSDARS
jgi:predicted NBD/HSP70 family sugar kinase